MMEALQKETVHMKDRNAVEKKLRELIAGGSSKLQVISDFDHTLSRVHKDGVKCPATHEVLKQASFVSEEYKQKTDNLEKHYFPIAIDPKLSKTEKAKYMEEWYTKGMNLMPISGIYKSHIPELVKTSNASLRDGCEALFEALNKHDVPLLIFSAGMGDVLIEVLKQRNLLLPNMKIVANFLRFDEKDRLQGYKDSFIHQMNKNQASMSNTDYFDSLKCRDNIILMGDNLGDEDMSEGAENVNVILKIGFLNCRIEEALSDYLDAFDIVLADDQTMDVVNGLLQNILS